MKEAKEHGEQLDSKQIQTCPRCETELGKTIKTSEVIHLKGMGVWDISQHIVYHCNECGYRHVQPSLTKVNDENYGSIE